MDFPTSPGPWTFGYTDDLQAPIIVDANDDVVCVMHDGVTTKDGKLMAAAQELLEALQESETLSELQFKMRLLVNRRRNGIAGIESDGDELAVEWRNVKSRADAIATRRFNAIAKATGKNPTDGSSWRKT